MNVCGMEQHQYVVLCATRYLVPVLSHSRTLWYGIPRLQQMAQWTSGEILSYF